MLNNRRLLLTFLCIVPFVFRAQEKPVKEKFIPEKNLHIKVGSTINFVNTRLFKILNSYSSDVFTPIKNVCFNPSADIEFDYQFSKHIGVNIDLGFMQTRLRYHYEHPNNIAINSSIPNNTTRPLIQQNPDGVILSNIPHLNISPSFYISNTRFNVGLGIYKYYYAFKPAGIGNIYFNLNSEDILIYSQIGVTQRFNFNSYKLTLSVNYFGLTKFYDQGVQVALGLAL